MTTLVRVRKYGGSSLATPEKIKSVAHDIAALVRRGQKFILVVSAMGKSTDQLHALARQISPVPDGRELDMLLSTGERVSMALMSMALHDLGIQSISFTGSQAGLLTDESHTSARIVDVKSVRVEQELNEQDVIVLAGFQGVSPKTKEITTLGRGGSDTTAVAVAAGFKAFACEILKDVDGVYSADPHQFINSRHLPQLHYDHLLDMTFWGAKVLHYRSVELASVMDVRIEIKLAHGDGSMTVISNEDSMYEKHSVLAMTTKSDVYRSQIKAKDLAEGYKIVSESLNQSSLPWPQLLSSTQVGSLSEFWWTTSSEAASSLRTVWSSHPQIGLDTQAYGVVTLTCQGLIASDMPQKIVERLSEKIEVLHIQYGAMGMSVFVRQPDLTEASALASQFLS